MPTEHRGITLQTQSKKEQGVCREDLVWGRKRGGGVPETQGLCTEKWPKIVFAL